MDFSHFEKIKRDAERLTRKRFEEAQEEGYFTPDTNGALEGSLLAQVEQEQQAAQAVKTKE